MLKRSHEYTRLTIGDEIKDCRLMNRILCKFYRNYGEYEFDVDNAISMVNYIILCLNLVVYSYVDILNYEMW